MVKMFKLTISILTKYITKYFDRINFHVFFLFFRCRVERGLLSIGVSWAIEISHKLYITRERIKGQKEAGCRGEHIARLKITTCQLNTVIAILVYFGGLKNKILYFHYIFCVHDNIIYFASGKWLLFINLMCFRYL